MKNIPNFISISRGLSAFLICFLLSIESEKSQWFAMIFFLIAIFSDYIDGYIARKFNAVSALGKVLDATIDKIFFFILICYFIITGIFSLYLMGLFLIIHILRDILVTTIRCHLLSKDIRVNVLTSGQIKTLFQFLFLLCGMVISILSYYDLYFEISCIKLINGITITAYFLYAISIVLSVQSGYSYLIMYFKNK